MKRVILWFAALFAAFSCGAQVPQLINYQGRLLNGTNLVNGSVGLSLRLFNVSGDGSILYEDSNSVAVVDGLYSTFIGDQTNSGNFASALTNAQVWVEVAVDGVSLSPRERLVSAAYAMRSERAEVFTGTISDSQLSANVARLDANQVFTGSNRFAGVVTLTNAANAFAGNAAGLTNLNAARITGTISSNNIAAGMISGAMLAKPPLSGSVASSALSLVFDQADCIITFAPAFDTTPNVTLSLETTDPTLPINCTLFLKSKATTYCVLHWAALPLTTPVTVHTNGDVGKYTSLAVVNGNPAISYQTNGAGYGDLKYVRATDADGTSWGTPVTVDASGLAGDYTSLQMVNGNPAISYHEDSADDLKYVRATDANGATWGTPVAVDTGSVGGHTSLEVVNGYPAISYYDSVGNDLKYVRAADAGGTNWGTPVTADASGGQYTSLAVVNGNPAISYYEFGGNNLRYVRATDADGTSWGTPVTLDAGGTVGLYTSLEVVNGYPAISYFDDSNDDLKYVRANDAGGTNWGTPVAVDTNGSVGAYPSLEVVSGKPAISYWDFGSGDLKYVRAADTNGATWGTPVSLDTAGNVGAYSSLAVVDGNPAVSYNDVGNGDLKFVRQRATNYPSFTINWIALEP